MKQKICLFFILCLHTATLFAQTGTMVLESKYRNPIDTSKISMSGIPCLALFVHSKCSNGHMCATSRMQMALENDSLYLRKIFGIKLYVIYPKYSQKDVEDYESYYPKNAVVAFDLGSQYKRTVMGDKKTFPYMVLFDGKGKKWTKEAGTYQSLCDSVTCWLQRSGINRVKCKRCGGNGLENDEDRLRLRAKYDPDYWICRFCNGHGYINKK